MNYSDLFMQLLPEAVLVITALVLLGAAVAVESKTGKPSRIRHRRAIGICRAAALSCSPALRCMCHRVPLDLDLPASDRLLVIGPAGPRVQGGGARARLVGGAAAARAAGNRAARRVLRADVVCADRPAADHRHQPSAVPVCRARTGEPLALSVGRLFAHRAGRARRRSSISCSAGCRRRSCCSG